MELVVQADGSLRCRFDEAVDLSALGQVTIRRASHVEPTDQGQWQADLSPVGGPVLGPFALLVAASRVVLGLHYPTDVLAGGLLGWLLVLDGANRNNGVIVTCPIAGALRIKQHGMDCRPVLTKATQTAHSELLVLRSQHS